VLVTFAEKAQLYFSSDLLDNPKRRGQLVEAW
jgi:hypothetical protein